MYGLFPIKNLKIIYLFTNQFNEVSKVKFYNKTKSIAGAKSHEINNNNKKIKGTTYINEYVIYWNQTFEFTALS